MQTRFLTILGLAAAMSGGGLNAQVENKVKVDVKDLKVQDQKTPQFNVSGLKEHSWRPKNWMELELSLDVKKQRTPGETSTMLDALEV